MNWRDYVRTALARHHATPDDEVVEELAQHAIASFETARADGLSNDDAVARVRSLVDAWVVAAPRRPLRLPAIETPPQAHWDGVYELTKK